jgi:hypothetical protein
VVVVEPLNGLRGASVGVLFIGVRLVRFILYNDEEEVRYDEMNGGWSVRRGSYVYK